MELELKRGGRDRPDRDPGGGAGVLPGRDRPGVHLGRRPGLLARPQSPALPHRGGPEGREDPRQGERGDHGAPRLCPAAGVYRHRPGGGLGGAHPGAGRGHPGSLPLGLQADGAPAAHRRGLYHRRHRDQHRKGSIALLPGGPHRLPLPPWTRESSSPTTSSASLRRRPAGPWCQTGRGWTGTAPCPAWRTPTPCLWPTTGSTTWTP